MQIEDLQNRGYKICQSEDLFKFGVDSVILTDYIYERFFCKYEKKTKKNLTTNFFDLCSGNAIIPTLIHAKFTKDENKHLLKINCIEINKKSFDLANTSIDINKDFGTKEDIHIINDDLNNIINNRENYSKYYQKFDAVTVNPPYIKKTAGLKNDDEDVLIARSEEKCSFDDICRVSQKLLLTKGSMFFIHKTFRLAEIICTLKKYNLEPKNLTFIKSFENSEPELFLMEAVKDGGEELHIGLSKIIYN